MGEELFKMEAVMVRNSSSAGHVVAEVWLDQFGR